MHAVKTLLLLYLANLVSANAITDAAGRAQRRDVAACEDLTSSTTSDGTTVTISSFPDSSCWDALDMTDWMKRWNATTVVCTAAQSLHTPCQCRIDEPWATCFMRLTYARNKTANYVCTDLTKPEDCTKPTPRNVVPGPVEIFYGAYSIWSSFHYLTVWYKTLTSPTSIPAITTELSKSKTSASSANNLLIALIQDFATDPTTSQAFTSILTSEPISSDDNPQEQPTLSNAQALLGQLLQQVLNYIMSDWANGYYLAMADGGTLLDPPAETTKVLGGRLAEE